MQSVTRTRRILAGVFAVLMVASGAGAAPFAFVPKSGTGKVVKIDLATGSAVADVVVPGGPLASTVSHNGRRVYSVLQSAGKVAVIDTASTSLVTTITSGRHPGARPCRRTTAACT